MSAHLLRQSIGPVFALALAGCATYPASRPSLTYFVVPCSTPGAFEVEQVGSPAGSATTEAVPPSQSPPPNGGRPPTTCLVAAMTPRAGYGRAYGVGGYYDPSFYGYGGYGYPFYGSIGIGFQGGHGFSHGGHFGHGAGHGGEGHGGGHHGH